MAAKLVAVLKGYNIVILVSHGSEAVGQTMDEAFYWSSILEETYEIALSAKPINELFIDVRSVSAGDNRWS